MRRLFLLCAFSCSLHSACIAVEGNDITARDLAKVDSAFSKLMPAYRFTYSPAVGSQRIVSGAELLRWAAQSGVQLASSEEVCFERPRFAISPSEISDKIRALFRQENVDVEIEVNEICECAVPAGRIEFTLSKVQPPPLDKPEVPVMWPGQVVTGAGVVYPIWVRVRVLALQTMIRATEDLRDKQVIRPEQVEEVKVETSPLRSIEVQKLSSYTGKALTRPVRRGTLLQPTYVRVPPAISAGSTVKVDIVNGDTRLTVEARAQTSGDPGEKITLLNPVSLLNFTALVTAPGRARLLLTTTDQMKLQQNVGEQH